MRKTILFLSLITLVSCNTDQEELEEFDTIESIKSESLLKRRGL